MPSAGSWDASRPSNVGRGTVRGRAPCQRERSQPGKSRRRPARTSSGYDERRRVPVLSPAKIHGFALDHDAEPEPFGVAEVHHDPAERVGCRSRAPSNLLVVETVELVQGTAAQVVEPAAQRRHLARGRLFVGSRYLESRWHASAGIGTVGVVGHGGQGSSRGGPVSRHSVPLSSYAQRSRPRRRALLAAVASVVVIGVVAALPSDCCAGTSARPR